jgi:CheY-like chemotaxis protein
LPEHSLAPHLLPVARPRRILVVDDDADSFVVLNRLLTLWGHEVVTAGSGGEAVERVRVHKPEVVLLDIGLPDADGFELVGPLRAANDRPMTVMAVTGHAWLDASLAVEAGFDGFFAKPIELDALQSCLASLPVTPD